MKNWIAFWNILSKDFRTYYLKPPNISWGLIFPLAWTGMFFIKSGKGMESRDFDTGDVGRVGLVLEVPIFEGGQVDAGIREAVKAARRGMQVCIGRAENLPFPRHGFDGVLMALTLCFLENPEKAFQECARVLRENAKLVLGTIPADSPWGRAYIRKGAEGHPVYAHARFHTIAETVHLVERSGFALRRSCSGLFGRPDNPSAGCSRVEPGIFSEAGFVGLLFGAHPTGG